ncbi:UDP-N-acetylmuramate--L-alanine ligase [Parafrankia colletiae]|uniref:UDP-N-acetylmuramate--L-alanine ligase n=1 Tax=Parafrankia colletiae TaxID=573497 RepID=A0A1S1RB23_9ACTN|nr:UDP-N-acetylmuramate--L-alanine ligase [Parafrankia colletiae]MCK9900477.1 UDP-N-acetylmuramate--L-alanine ligase [Frankia sp. Cpl3]OHV43186.1 UDP-N-acetylmuramate--L-alanine ligase [Parafrankia colletiae]
MVARDLPDGWRRVHLVGIGGVAMSGLARLLVARGAVVSGSDAVESRQLATLRALGIPITVGRDPAAVDPARFDGVELVVVAPAVRLDDPQLAEARRRELRILTRSAALAGLMQGHRGVAVAGSHGKTTVAMMLTAALQAGGEDLTFAVGGDPGEAGSHTHAGSSDLMVVEAEEEGAAFWQLQPHGAVLTGVAPEHLDYYRTVPALRASFATFLHRIEPAGFLVACVDDEAGWALATAAARDAAAALAPGDGAAGRPSWLIGYGFGPSADVRLSAVEISPARTSAQVVAHGVPLGRMVLKVPGRHHLLDGAAALATGLALGARPEGLLTGLASFAGVRRRFEPLGSARGVRVVDDYANHPDRVAAAIATARALAGGGRVVVAFQPHLYTRTALLAEDFGAALRPADVVVVMDVYGGAQRPEPGAGGARVASAARGGTAEVFYEPSWSAVPGVLLDRAAPGDLVLTLGAGDVTQIGPELLRLLAGRTS